MNALERRNGLQLHEHTPIDDEVCAQPLLDASLTEDGWNHHFLGDLMPCFAKTLREENPICLFQQAWPELALKLYGGVEDATAGLVDSRIHV